MRKANRTCKTNKPDRSKQFPTDNSFIPYRRILVITKSIHLKVGFPILQTLIFTVKSDDSKPCPTNNSYPKKDSQNTKPNH